MEMSRVFRGLGKCPVKVRFAEFVMINSLNLGLFKHGIIL